MHVCRLIGVKTLDEMSKDKTKEGMVSYGYYRVRESTRARYGNRVLIAFTRLTRPSKY